MQTGVAKGLKVPCLFMIAEVSIRCQENPEVGIRRIPPNTPLGITLCYLHPVYMTFLPYQSWGKMLSLATLEVC